MITRVITLTCLLIAVAQPCLADPSCNPVLFHVPRSPFCFVQGASGFHFEGKPQKDFDVASLLNQLNLKLSKVWIPDGCKNQAPLPLIVAFDLSSDGQISNIVLQRSSGVTSTDSSLLESLQKISPIKPLQEGVLSVGMTLMFSYIKETESRKKPTIFLDATCDSLAQ